MIEIFNSDKVPINERYDYWREYICNCHLLVSATRSIEDDAPFSAVIRGAILSDILLTNWLYDSLDDTDIIRIDRTERHIATDAHDTYILVYNGLLEALFTQHGREIVVPQNSFCLFTSYPYQVLNKHKSGGFFVSIPRYRLQGLLASPEVLGVRVVPADVGVARLLLAFCKELPVIQDDLPLPASEILADQLASMVALVFQPSSEGMERIQTTLSERCYRSVLDYMDVHLTNPDLSASHIANQVGKSPGYLSRLFSMHNTSFQEQLRLRRIDRASCALRNPVLSHLSITDIAYKNGFSCISHFSRCFKQRYNMSPREYRTLHFDTAS